MKAPMSRRRSAAKSSKKSAKKSKPLRGKPKAKTENKQPDLFAAVSGAPKARRCRARGKRS